MDKFQIGIIGLGVMGKNLAQNFLNKGFRLSVYNKEPEVVEQFLISNEDNSNLAGFYRIDEFLNSLETPRKIITMVTAGKPVDEVIELILPYLSVGDIIIDAGNSYFLDTERRYNYLKERGIHLIGMGISGGASGALNGPSLMPGGDFEAYKIVEAFLTKVAAQSKYGPCVSYIGNRSAGHFVKMIHNGIEYALMGAIAEAYDIMKNILNLDYDEMAGSFSNWESTLCGGFLLSAAVNVLRLKDSSTNKPIVDVILDVAGQKGTGLWTSQVSLEIGVPLPTIISSVLTRFISTFKDIRSKIARRDKCTIYEVIVDKMDLLEKIKKMLIFDYVIAFTEGLWIINEVSKKFSYDINIVSVLKVWRKGSIIESNIIDLIILQGMQNFFLIDNEEFLRLVNDLYPDVIKLSSLCKEYKVPLLVTDTALNFYLSMSRRELPTNFIQGIRDYFGYHGFYRVDAQDKLFHLYG